VCLREAGGTVLVVEQNARAALAIADRAYVLENGRIGASGIARELLGDESVQDAYLGGAGGGARAIEARIRAKRSAILGR
jgi:ABC-type branched-subunit amino acid transport system ATPase component